MSAAKLSKRVVITVLIEIFIFQSKLLLLLKFANYSESFRCHRGERLSEGEERSLNEMQVS